MYALFNDSHTQNEKNKYSTLKCIEQLLKAFTFESILYIYKLKQYTYIDASSLRSDGCIKRN